MGWWWWSCCCCCCCCLLLLLLLLLLRCRASCLLGACVAVSNQSRPQTIFALVGSQAVDGGRDAPGTCCRHVLGHRVCNAASDVLVFAPPLCARCSLCCVRMPNLPALAPACLVLRAAAKPPCARSRLSRRQVPPCRRSLRVAVKSPCARSFLRVGVKHDMWQLCTSWFPTEKHEELLLHYTE